MARGLPRRAVLAMGLGLLGACAGTAERAVPAGRTAAAEAALTHTVAAILRGEIPPGAPVTVVGHYRGWDLFGEVGVGPPVGRSDWVVKDAGGAIYVRAGVPMTRAGQPGAAVRLAPQDKGEGGRLLRVRGTVRATAGGQRYIEPASIEILD